LTLFTLVNASGEHKKPQIRSHKWHRMFAEVRPNSECCRAEPSRTFCRILRRLPNFGPSLVSKLWQIIGQIFPSESGVPHFNVLVGGDPLPQWLKCKIRGGGTLHSGLGPWKWSCAFP